MDWDSKILHIYLLIAEDPLLAQPPTLSVIRSQETRCKGIHMHFDATAIRLPPLPKPRTQDQAFVHRAAPLSLLAGWCLQRASGVDAV